VGWMIDRSSSVI